ncbi:DUF4302 domain-containing protein [Reichenbachiella faecimaris]|nr:DUF4302 domain-containing protein [Reichenbachiella faecimaris]
MVKNILLLLVAIVFLSSCDNGLEKITPPAERSAEAISNLRDDLVAPTNGWVLNYQPTLESGIFYILLNFNDDGTVRIQSDVPGDNDYFYDQTVSYRIDTRLSLELVFETYAVLHYLFEQNQSTFGAEFEFYYVDKEGDNLRFASKSDNDGEQTVISLEPAGADASDVFSRELAENLLAYDTISSLFIGPMQQIALTDRNVSIFWSMNLVERSVTIRNLAEGVTTSDISATNNTLELEHESGYGFFDGKLVLTEPLETTFMGAAFNFSEMTLSTFSETGEILCTGGTANSPVYTGSSTGLGSATMYKTLYDVKGTEFQPMEDSPYSVNVFFVADADGISMSRAGSINDYFPTATGFAFNYGFIDSDSAYYACSADSLVQPENAVGLYYEDENGNLRLGLRKFDVVSAVDNKVEIQFTTSTDPLDDYYPCDLTNEERTNLAAITDEIFGTGGGEIHAAYDFFRSSGSDLDVFTLYNACNNYEFLLVQ